MLQVSVLHTTVAWVPDSGEPRGAWPDHRKIEAARTASSPLPASVEHVSNVLFPGANRHARCITTVFDGQLPTDDLREFLRQTVARQYNATPCDLVGVGFDSLWQDWNFVDLDPAKLVVVRQCERQLALAVGM